MTRIVNVALASRSYDITIGSGTLARAGEILRPVLHSPRVMLITDSSVAVHHLQTLQNSLSATGLELTDPIIMAPGEKTKSLSAFESLIEDLLDRAQGRGVTLMALGGGVVGDITGFAAATVLRGVDYIQVPTTLLAQVDSSVGGRTGINSRNGRNLMGVSHQPRAILIDPDVLKTLPRRELLAGYAEMVKYGIINNPSFYEWCIINAKALLEGDTDILTEAIAESCTTKSRIVIDDEREAGPRMLLNLGHSFAHAIEAESGYESDLLHGEAVAVGLVLVLRLSARLKLCARSEADRLEAHFRSIGLPASLKETPCSKTSPETLLAHMYSDKRVEGGKLPFILARGIGHAFAANHIDPLPVIETLSES